MAGSLSGFLVTPFDVVKTRLMIYDVKKETPNTFRIFTDILREEGLKGLYRGALIRMMYLGVGGFAFFGIYEKIKLTLINHFE